MEQPISDKPAADPLALHRRALALVREQRLEEAFALHLQAAGAGVRDSMLETGRMLLYGAGTTADVPAAIGWLERAEAAGSVIAGYELALLQVDGALPRDARLDARVGAAVHAGFPPALRAAALQFGRRAHPADQSLCVELLRQAAQAGDALAALLLAERLQRGEGTPARPDRADVLYGQLRRQGIAPLPDVDAPLPDQPPATPGQTELVGSLAHAPAAQVLSEQPGIRRIDRLLSTDECRLLIAAARPRLQASEVVRTDDGGGQRAGNRTSSDATFDALSQDLALRIIQQRMAAAAATDLLHGEPLIVLRYEPGQEYQPHRDYAPPGAIERDHPEAGNRARTICTYLNRVEAGGATEFPTAGVRIAPQAGSAVVFDNLHADGRPDPDTLHAGLPVERGEKWLATIWLRERRYRSW
jgi:hypothetical protein